MKTAVVGEAPAVYGAKAMFDEYRASRGEARVLLHGISWETYDRLIEETGESRKTRFAYDHGEFEIWGGTGSHVVLHGVSWETYERLIEETGPNRNTRFAYDNGDLEIMAPQYPHEGSNRKFEHLIMALARAFKVEFSPAGSLTCNNKALLKGIEPDSCFYIQHVDAIGDTIDLEKDPPPDLMIEIDIARSSLNKLKICRALKVPEHWRFNGVRLEIRILRGGAYVETDESAAFPGVPLKEALPRFIEPGRGIKCVKMVDEFSKWLRTNLRSRNKTRSEKKRS